jgi:L-fucose mutarotase/ribose pyranase (RbsD/FucU family)
MTASIVPEWKAHLSTILPLFGHRNWIVVADSAYPAQSRPGIETIIADGSQADVVRHVFDAITTSGHLRAKVYVDKELAFVSEQEAPGVEEYRKQLDAALTGARVHSIPHEHVIARLDEAAQVFRILIIKTSMAIPYTSVFFELDCGYWSVAAEVRLRDSMAAAEANEHR